MLIMMENQVKVMRRFLLILAVIGLLIIGCINGAENPTTTLSSPPAVFAWVVDEPQNQGFDPGRLAEAANWAKENNSDSLLVIRNGYIVLENYWNGIDQNAPLPVWSVTKSVVSTLVGIARYNGYLNIDDPVAKYINELVGTDSESVTIRNILSNDSGRFWNLVGDLLVAADPTENLTEYAIARGQQYEPGTAWQYNQMAIQCLDRVLSVATGQSTAIFAQEYLFDPLGMTHTTVELDDMGQMIMSWGIQSTARDMARLGYLYLSGGEWDNEQLLSQEYIKEATSPSNDINPAYGYLWWLNAVEKWYEPVTLIYHEGDQAYPDAPLDVYVASGFMGQIIMVSPSDNMVIVRQGHDPLGIDSPIHNSLYRGIAAALN